MVGMYSRATSGAIHVTTRLRMDAVDSAELFRRAESTLHGVRQTLFQLDRLTLVHGNEEAAQLAEQLRAQIGSLALKAQETVDLPKHALHRSPDLRDHYLGASLAQASTPSVHLPDEFVEKLLDVDS